MAPCLGLRMVQDANLHVTIVAAVAHLGTEGEESWNILNGCTKDLTIIMTLQQLIPLTGAQEHWPLFAKWVASNTETFGTHGIYVRI